MEDREIEDIADDASVDENVGDVGADDDVDTGDIVASKPASDLGRVVPATEGVGKSDKPKVDRTAKIVIIVAACILALLVCTLAVSAVRGSMSAGMSETANHWGSASNEKTMEDAAISTDTGSNATHSSSTSGDALDVSSDTSVKEARAYVTTRSYDNTVAAVSELVSSNGAKVTARHDTRGGGWHYIYGNTVERSDAAREMNLTLSVPNDKVYAFLDGVSAIDGIEVELLDVRAEDASDELEGISKTRKEIEDEIADVEERMNNESMSSGQRAQLQAKLDDLNRSLEMIDEGKADLDKRIESSEVSLRIREVVNPTGDDALSEAMTSSLTAFTSNVSWVLAIIVWALPYMLLVAFVVGIIALVKRKPWEKKKAGDMSDD